MTDTTQPTAGTPPKRGRPCVYDPDIAAAICARLACGESLRAICRDDAFPPESTVRGWAVDDVDGFAARYARARDIGLDTMADELLEIADTPREGVRTESSDDGIKTVTEDMLGHRRLQIDARKWYLAKLAPKRYGDKLELGGQVKSYVVQLPPEAESSEDWAKEGGE